MVEAERIARQLGTASTAAELEELSDAAASWLEGQDLETPAARLVLDALHTAAHRADELRAAP
jgi:hypothetical protein